MKEPFAMNERAEIDLANIFISEQKPYKGNSSRDKFLSRLFGIFNEKIVRIWCNNSRSPFEDLGRPTIYTQDKRYFTLDFLLKDQSDRTFITEMKCEIEYQKYKYFTLTEAKQVERHKKKRAFELLLHLANNPSQYRIGQAGNDVTITGTALVWGKVLPPAVKEIKECFGFDHVLSLENMISDLIGWEDRAYKGLITEYSCWCNELFLGLGKC